MKLKRVLTASDAGWIVAGSMIGAGIFYFPGLVAGHLSGLGMPMLAWALGGLLALCGAAIYAELGARIPEAGGDYRYLTEAFGPLWGFLTGWAAFLLTFSAAVAGMVIVVLDYAETAIPSLEGTFVTRNWAAGPVIVLGLTLANVAGARVAGKTTAVLTAVPVIGLFVLFGYGLLAGEAELHWPEPQVEADGSPLGGLGPAMILIFFAYTGWNQAAYLAGEMRSPGRDLVRGLLIGTGSVTLLYLLFNAVLLLVVPVESLAGSTTAGSLAARMLLGPVAERSLAGVIALCVLGTAHVTLMAGSRIYYAMALDGLAPRAMSRVNRAGVPSTALWVGGIWTAALTVFSEVETLVNWATLSILLLSSMAVAALFVLRRRDPAPAAFSVPGYPVTPWIYIGASIWVAYSSALYYGWNSAIAAAIVGAGFPAYFLFRRFFDD